jgi:hypothetical protein
MKIRWTGLSVAGRWHDDPNGVKTGQVVDVEDHHARRYIKAELAVPADGDASAHF